MNVRTQIWFYLMWWTYDLHAFYAVAEQPVQFRKGEHIDVKAVKMTSIRTHLPYGYYSVEFCLPKTGKLVYNSQNLGQILRGDRIVNTPYEVRMAENVDCQLLCNKTNRTLAWGSAESGKVMERIRNEYFVYLLIDDLPAATISREGHPNENVPDSPRKGIELGYRLGRTEDNNTYINNHLKFLLTFRMETEYKYHVVGFQVEPMSVDRQDIRFEGDVCQFPVDAGPQALNNQTLNLLYFTYSVEWIESNITWASRWDLLLTTNDVQTHWIGIITSLVIVLSLAVSIFQIRSEMGFTSTLLSRKRILCVIMVRTLQHDIARCNAADPLKNTLAKPGWTRVRGDVFRPPKNPELLADVVGVGIQMLFTVLITIFQAMLGLMPPTSGRSFLSFGIIVYVATGLIAGYFSGRLYKTLKGSYCGLTASFMALYYPAFTLSVLFTSNLLAWIERSSLAAPINTVLFILFLWLVVSIPLTYLGHCYGYSKPPYQHPVPPNIIPRQIPKQKWYLNLPLCSLAAGIIPFGIIYTELEFVFTAIWHNQLYSQFGYLFIIFCIFVVSCAEVSIIMTYFQLCREDYRWWWRSCITSAGSAVYFYLYTIYYCVNELSIIGNIPQWMYVCYTGLMTIAFCLLSSSIGFFASYIFIKLIYGAVKAD